MKQNIQNFILIIQMKRMILIAGILSAIFISPTFSHAQIDSLQFEFEGLDRNCRVFLPQNYQPNMPVVFNLHGYTCNAQFQIDYTLMNDVADTAGFIVVYPDAIEPGFNGGVWIPDTPHLDTTINDVGFISALIDTINVHYDIDTNRVYCCGLSNGGQMTYRLTCQLGHRFAAVASVSGLVSDNSTAGCLSYPPIPILHMHGTADNIVPYGGSTYQWGVEETLNFWLEKNGCSLPTDTIFLPDIDPNDGCTVQKISYTNCEDNSCLIFYKVIDGGHSWPSAAFYPWWSHPTNKDINANVEIWNFFKDYPPIYCLPEGITFTTQEEIDNFQINYPGCTEIEGDVAINGDDVSNLNGLNVLYSIGGNLLIGDDEYSYNENPLLNNLTGLDNLTSIEGDLDISGNDALESLLGLNNLTSVNGGLSFWYNDSLTNLTGLENLTTIQGDLVIYGQFNLEALTGLNNLYEIEGNLIIGFENDPGGNGGNPLLLNFTGLDNLHTVGGDLWIRGNYSLSSLSGLDNLNSIGGNLFIVCNPLLKSLTGLDNLNNIGGIFKVGWDLQGFGWTNNNLKSFNGLGNLTSIGGDLTILSCDSLENFQGLEALNTIGDGLHISYNDLLNTFQGLENLTSVNGQIYISGGNPSLISLSGLDNIDAGSIGNLHVQNNASLSTCEVQSICDYLAAPNGTVVILDNANGCNNPPEIADACGYTMPCLPYGDYYFYYQSDIDSFQSSYPGCIQLEGDVIISGNNITNLYGLNEITSISGNLLIRSNPSLTGLIGLENLNSIGGDLKISNCDSLTSLTGLENLTYVAGNIIIGGSTPNYANPSLLTLSGLDNIDAGTIENINIQYNTSLSDCDAQSICDYLANPNGTIVISDNAPGCNSQQEVQDDCDSVTSVSEFVLEETLIIFPNPLESTSVIKYNIPYKSPVTIKIFDLTGQEIKTLVNEIQQQGEQQLIFNTRNLPSGIYFCVLKTNNGKQTRRIIKL